MECFQANHTTGTRSINLLLRLDILEVLSLDQADLAGVEDALVF